MLPMSQFQVWQSLTGQRVLVLVAPDVHSHGANVVTQVAYLGVDVAMALREGRLHGAMGAAPSPQFPRGEVHDAYMVGYRIGAACTRPGQNARMAVMH